VFLCAICPLVGLAAPEIHESPSVLHALENVEAFQKAASDYGLHSRFPSAELVEKRIVAGTLETLLELKTRLEEDDSSTEPDEEIDLRQSTDDLTESGSFIAELGSLVYSDHSSRAGFKPLILSQDAPLTPEYEIRDSQLFSVSSLFLLQFHDAVRERVKTRGLDSRKRVVCLPSDSPLGRLIFVEPGDSLATFLTRANEELEGEYQDVKLPDGTIVSFV
jgi:hypothetical protein